MTERWGSLDHVGIVVADLEESEGSFLRLGFSVLYRERVTDQGVDIVGISAGGDVIELLKPISTESPLVRFLGDKRSRLHHFAYRVNDLPDELARLKAAGVRLIDEAPRRGAHGKLIAFVHPSFTGGSLIELCQPESPKTGR